jgi:predicted transcriptional regulator
MSQPHTSYRLSEDAKRKLQELADLTRLSKTDVLNNLIQGEHRFRRDEIEKMKKDSADTENASK